MRPSILVTDFDSTITRRDFYSTLVEELLEPEDLQPWHDYVAGYISHFEALRRIFMRITATEAEVAECILPRMEFDPAFKDSVGRLNDGGWEVVIVSNGCGWYIERLLRSAGVELAVHTNPGQFVPGNGLMMELPENSPFFERENGISKLAVVEEATTRYDKVAFAGDGRPDLQPALRVPSDLRFAREWLADELTRLGKTFHDINVWSDIADYLVPHS